MVPHRKKVPLGPSPCIHWIGFLFVVGIVYFLYYYDSRFYATSGKHNEAELKQALQRKAKGRAAVVIIRVDQDKYLVQRKSNDYPIPAFRNAVCLFGGNAMAADPTPLYTLQRELAEELPPTLVQAILRNAKFLNLTLHSQTAEMMHAKEEYAFACASYTSMVDSKDIPSQFTSAEGSHVLLTRDQLTQEETFAWGYDAILSNYFQQPVQHFASGVTVTQLDKEVLKEWSPPA